MYWMLVKLTIELKENLFNSSSGNNLSCMNRAISYDFQNDPSI